jgi:pyridoxamine 5'-phosphate oxidase
MNRDIASIRKDYQLASLDEASTLANPMDQFGNWWKEAIESNIEEVNAFTLSTIGLNGHPTARVVLLKGFTPVAMNFFWKELERQVRINGTIKKVSTEESEQYFHSRPIGSQLGALTSPQSQVIPNRAFLEELMAANVEKYKDGNVPLPPHWGGYIIHPTSIEFWQGRSSRLHDRLQYTLQDNHGWTKVRLAP